MKIRSVRGTHDLYGPELVKYKVIEILLQIRELIF